MRCWIWTNKNVYWTFEGLLNGDQLGEKEMISPDQITPLLRTFSFKGRVFYERIRNAVNTYSIQRSDWIVLEIAVWTDPPNDNPCALIHPSNQSSLALSSKHESVSTSHFIRLQNSRFRTFSEGGKRRKRDPRVWSARARRFYTRSRPFVRIWSVARDRKKYDCFAVYIL